LRRALEALELRSGVTELHRQVTERLKAHGAVLKHRFGHEEPQVAWALSPDGRHVATGSWVGGDYERGGVLQIFEVETGRSVNVLDPIEGGVGWPDYPNCIQWSPQGDQLAMAHNTNGVGNFLPFDLGSMSLTEAWVTDGWSRPPA